MLALPLPPAPATLSPDSAHRRAEALLRGLLRTLIPLGLLANVAQLLTVPGYLPIFVVLSVALSALFVALWLVQRGRYLPGLCSGRLVGVERPF